MTDVEIGRAYIEDIELINEFIRIVLSDTFQRNGITDLVDTFNDEINNKRLCLNQDFESGGSDIIHNLVSKGERENAWTQRNTRNYYRSAYT